MNQTHPNSEKEMFQKMAICVTKRIGRLRKEGREKEKKL